MIIPSILIVLLTLLVALVALLIGLFGRVVLKLMKEMLQLDIKIGSGKKSK